MKILLLEDVPSLGYIGDEVLVKDGYARNYLIPKKKAQIISSANQKEIQKHKKLLAMKAQKNIEQNQIVADKINSLNIVFSLKATETGTLFGSVNSKMILAELAKHNVHLNTKHSIDSEHIKSVGDYQIPIQLHPEVEAELKLSIVAEKDSSVKEETSSENS